MEIDYKGMILDNHWLNPVPGLQPMRTGLWVHRSLEHGQDTSYTVTVNPDYPGDVIVWSGGRHWTLPDFNARFTGAWVGME